MATAIVNTPPVLSTTHTGGLPVPKWPHYIPVAEYLRREEIAVEKSEYREGEILPMPGASIPHTILTNNVGGELYLALKKQRDCTVHSSDLKIHIATQSAFRYPDIAVVRGVPARFAGRTDTITNPVVLVEILSPSTEGSDRGDKFEEYQTLESLQDYVLVSQSRPRIEVYSRASDGEWKYRGYAGLPESATVPSLGIVLALADVYDKVAFASQEKSDAQAGNADTNA